MASKVLKNKRGAFSIIAVILVFIVVLAITAFGDITAKTWTLNEIQSIMDTAGVNSLQSSIDLDKLRTEVFGIDGKNEADIEAGKLVVDDYKSKIVAKYDTEFRKYVKTNNTIVSVDKQDIFVTFNYDSWGLGTSVKARPQILLEATYKVTLKGSSRFDTLNPSTKYILSAIRNGKSFSVDYNGTDEDGNLELIIRSASRIVYR